MAAFLVVFMMVTTSFVAILASGDEDPEIWTNRDEYAPGETVYIFGDGFFRWIDVEIELYHPDLGTTTFVEKPDLEGRFSCDDYVAEWVVSQDTPVIVTATQHLEDGDLVATTQFWDPAAFIEGYTLKPNHRWTTGDIKGYNEGDSIPMSVVLNRQQLGGVGNVTIIIGVDFFDLNSPTEPTYAIDYLTDGYEDEPPSAPYNNHPNSTMPFWVDPTEGTITNQERLPNHVSDEGPFQILQVWRFDMDFATSATNAIVKFGAHLAVTDLSQDPEFLGASYYPGSSAHVRMIDMWPSADEGNRDVPIMISSVLIPPKMNLEKWCDPTMVAMGDEITFTLHWNNTGQAAATCVVLSDDLPWVVDLDASSFLYWTSENPVKMPVSPLIDDRHFEYTVAFWRGTGTDSALLPLEGYLEFTATVNTNENGCYDNCATLTYTDDHEGYYPPEIACCTFCIIGEPEIDVEKSGPMYAHVGDTVTYEYTITNTGPLALVDVDAYDDVAGVVVEDDTLAVGESKSYTLEYEIQAGDPDHLVNEVDVTGEDSYGRTATDSDSWEIDILHPDIIVNKVVDPECAEIGEEVDYTITVTNPTKNTTLYYVEVDDPILGTWSVGTLLPGQTETIEESLLINDTHTDPLINTVTAVGEDILGLEVSDDDQAVVEIYHPMVEVTKEANLECAEPGETVTYWINVTNPSWDTDLVEVIVSDPMFDDYDSVNSVPYDPIYSGPIASGATVYLGPFDYVVPQDVEEVYNIVVVDAWDVQRHYVHDWAIWTVEVFHPAIAIDKWSDWECAEEGETVEYFIDVWNPSYDATMTATVYDKLLSVDPLWSGDLTPGASHQIGPLPYVVPSQTELVENTAYVWAYDHQLHDEYAEDSWEIEIFHPDIEIRKWSEWECAEEGETVEYWIEVSNPSWDATMDVEVYDSMLLVGAPLWTGYLKPGDDATLGPYRYVIPEDTEWVINTAYVDAWDHQDHYVYDESTWEIEIFHPAISI
ncbi:MAG: hypothetical protein OEM29_03410, partial [Thermoplasmata archaeon]|nr:hypothetical protein [Thermoplasmata archaeon]